MQIFFRIEYCELYISKWILWFNIIAYIIFLKIKYNKNHLKITENAGLGYALQYKRKTH